MSGGDEARRAFSWPRPPADITLAGDDVHVWRVWLDLPPSEVARLRQLLSPDERERAARFVSPRDRGRYITGRGALRSVLGRYLREPPRSLRFRYSPHGKPSLADPLPLRFNLAHSSGLALIAVAWRREIGVDVEIIRAGVADELIARRFFSPREVEELIGLAEEKRQAAFFACWTCKEAYLKARGEGLSIPLNRFAVSVDPDRPAALRYVEGAAKEVARWTLCRLHPWPGYAAALAVEGHGWRLSCWQWDDPPAGRAKRPGP